MKLERRFFQGLGQRAEPVGYSFGVTDAVEGHPHRLEVIENDRFTCERYRGSQALSEQVMDEIGAVYTDAFKSRLAQHYGEKNVHLFVQYDIRQIRGYVGREDTHVVLLREKLNQNIVGFSYATPMDDRTKTVEMSLTAISEDSRGLGGWSLMMQGLENGIAADTRKYKRMTIMATTKDNFDEKFRKRYKRRIIREQDIFSSHGHHREITVRLGRNPLSRIVHR